MTAITITNLLGEIHYFEEFLTTQRGYDHARAEFMVKHDELTLIVTARDNFQENVAPAEQVQNGMFFLRSEDHSLTPLWREITALPSRRERELRFLMRSAGAAAEIARDLHDESARAFAERLAGVRASYAGLLADETARP